MTDSLSILSPRSASPRAVSPVKAKPRRIKLAAATLVVLCLSGCPRDYPVDLGISGLPARPLDTAIAEASIREEQLVIRLEAPEGRTNLDTGG